MYLRYVNVAIAMKRKVLMALGYIDLYDFIDIAGGKISKDVWRKYGVDELLRKAHEKGSILSGLSAGAIAWFRYGSSDSRRFMKNGKQMESLMRVSALGFLPFTVSPHHIREKKLRDPGIKKIMQRTPGVALALDDNSAILVQDGRYEILRSQSRVNVKKVFRKKGKVEWKNLEESGTLEDLATKN